MHTTVWRKKGIYACYQCNADERIVKWDTTNNNDSNCSSGYDLVSGVSQESKCAVYSIEYNANDGIGRPKVQYNVIGKTIKLSSEEPTKDGYTFLGWSINSNYTVPNYKPGANFSNIEGKKVVTLYAVWEKNSECYKCNTNPNILRWKSSSAGDADCSAGYDIIDKDEDICNSYTIKYSASGASNVPGVQHKPHGVTISLSTERPTKKGYTFEGWSTSSSATSVNYEKGDDFSANKNTTLYAVWSKIEVLHNVKIKYNPVGGEVAASTDAGSWKVVDNLIYKNDNLLTTVVEYGDRLGENGLIDYYSGANLKVTKTGYSAELGEEWICLEGCTTSNKVFNQVDDYSASEFCDASKSDCEVTLGVNWQVSKVNIKYNTNGGVFTEITDNGNKIWSVANDALYLNGSLHKTTIEYGGKLGVNGLTDYNSFANLYITKAGRIAKPGAEWLCAYGDCEVGKTYSQKEIYSASDFCDASKGNCTAVLGVNWIKNKVSINYDPYGGIVEPSTNGGTWKVVDDMIYKNDSLLTTTVEYYGKLDSNGLIDYYSGENLKITRTGYSVKSGEEWVCISGDCLPGKVYSHAISYNASDFCDTTYNDCSVILGVNWQVNKYTIRYNGNGSTSGTTDSSVYEYDLENSLTKNGYVKSGYKFNGWNTKLDGSGTSYTDEQIVKNLSSTNGSTVTLYAQWTADNYIVKYDANGGIGTMSDSTYTYGVSKALSANSFSRTDYTFKCWNTKADGSGVNYTDKQSIKIAENLTLYAQWRSNNSTDEEEEIEIKYYIRYDKNGGIGTMKNSEHTYDYASNLSKNIFKRTGYTFNGWNTKADGTGVSYTDEQTISNLTSTNGEVVTLYAQWSEIVGEEVPTTPGNGSDNSGNQGNNNSNNNIDKSPPTGMLATILVSLIGIGAFGGLVYYRRKVKI